MIVRPLGLYIHIPFCSALCHYCDFSKTANFQSDHVDRYFAVLWRHLDAWRNHLGSSVKFSSVFFGGGTPGLFTREYGQLMSLIHTMIAPGAEITLEANPDNVNDDSVGVWRSLGFNRLSIGVQSFDPIGLKELTRLHDAHTAVTALELAAKHFPKSNGDLIYGWPGQELASWRNDLNTMTATGINHLSLYALTFEGQTPFARAERRGKKHPMLDDELAVRYDVACELLAQQGLEHEEISNWSSVGTTCDHNWLYWRGHHYLGIGAGAHGYVDDGSSQGIRYSYPRDFREMLRTTEPLAGDARTILGLIQNTGGIVDEDRDLESWKLEYVGCGLRCSGGVDLGQLAKRGFVFRPNARVDRGLAENLITRQGDRLLLSEKEWFRETAWSHEVCESLLGG